MYFFSCYQVVIIKLPKGQNLSKLPNNPASLELSTHEEVHKNGGHGAYVAEAFTRFNIYTYFSYSILYSH